jgi:hypothetical protein
MDALHTTEFVYIVTWQLKDQNSGTRRDGICYLTADKHVSA